MDLEGRQSSIQQGRQIQLGNQNHRQMLRIPAATLNEQEGLVLELTSEEQQLRRGPRKQPQQESGTK
jgi:hypothetical protein